MVVMGIVTVIVIVIAIVIVMHLIVMFPEEVPATRDLVWAMVMADPTIDPIPMNTVSRHRFICYKTRLMSPA